MTHRLLPMMAISALIGAASSIIGFYVSYHGDVATGPAIVLTATVIFIFVFVEQQARLWLRTASPLAPPRDH
jgi:ABC-type Mn2+/Zn2+ transport system permease subunit